MEALSAPPDILFLKKEKSKQREAHLRGKIKSGLKRAKLKK